MRGTQEAGAALPHSQPEPGGHRDREPLHELLRAGHHTYHVPQCLSRAIQNNNQFLFFFLSPFFYSSVQIPFFKEIIVSAFSCPHCGYESKDVQSGATIQRLGVRYTLTLNKAAVCFPFTPFSLFFFQEFHS